MTFETLPKSERLRKLWLSATAYTSKSSARASILLQFCVHVTSCPGCREVSELSAVARLVFPNPWWGDGFERKTLVLHWKLAILPPQPLCCLCLGKPCGHDLREASAILLLFPVVNTFSVSKIPSLFVPFCY